MGRRRGAPPSRMPGEGLRAVADVEPVLAAGRSRRRERGGHGPGLAGEVRPAGHGLPRARREVVAGEQVVRPADRARPGQCKAGARQGRRQRRRGRRVGDGRPGDVFHVVVRAVSIRIGDLRIRAHPLLPLVAESVAVRVPERVGRIARVQPVRVLPGVRKAVGVRVERGDLFQAVLRGLVVEREAIGAVEGGAHSDVGPVALARAAHRDAELALVVVAPVDRPALVGRELELDTGQVRKGRVEPPQVVARDVHIRHGRAPAVERCGNRHGVRRRDPPADGGHVPGRVHREEAGGRGAGHPRDVPVPVAEQRRGGPRPVARGVERVEVSVVEPLRVDVGEEDGLVDGMDAPVCEAGVAELERPLAVGKPLVRDGREELLRRRGEEPVPEHRAQVVGCRPAGRGDQGFLPGLQRRMGSHVERVHDMVRLVREDDGVAVHDLGRDFRRELVLRIAADIHAENVHLPRLSHEAEHGRVRADEVLDGDRAQIVEGRRNEVEVVVHDIPLVRVETVSVHNVDAETVPEIGVAAVRAIPRLDLRLNGGGQRDGIHPRAGEAFVRAAHGRLRRAIELVRLGEVVRPVGGLGAAEIVHLLPLRMIRGQLARRHHHRGVCAQVVRPERGVRLQGGGEIGRMGRMGGLEIRLRVGQRRALRIRVEDVEQRAVAHVVRGILDDLAQPADGIRRGHPRHGVVLDVSAPGPAQAEHQHAAARSGERLDGADLRAREVGPGVTHDQHALSAERGGGDGRGDGAERVSAADQLRLQVAQVAGVHPFAVTRRVRHVLETQDVQPRHDIQHQLFVVIGPERRDDAIVAERHDAPADEGPRHDERGRQRRVVIPADDALPGVVVAVDRPGQSARVHQADALHEVAVVDLGERGTAQQAGHTECAESFGEETHGASCIVLKPGEYARGTSALRAYPKKTMMAVTQGRWASLAWRGTDRCGSSPPGRPPHRKNGRHHGSS